MLFASDISALDPSKKIHHYIHRSWQAIDGLPQNSANSIVQTDDGYIWIATQEGLTRFDGLNFTVFSRATHPEILSNDLRSLFKGPDGTLWIGTYSGGAVEFKNNIFTTYNKESGISENLIKTIYVDENNNVWLGTFKNGINIISNRKISVFDSLSGLPDNSVRAITGKNGDIWAGTLNGLALIRNFKVEKIFREDSGLRSSNISALFIDSKDTLWVGTKTGYLHFLEEGRFRSFKVPGLVGTDFVNVIFEDSDHNFWIGTEKGLHRFKNGSFETLTVESGLTYNAVRSIFEDSERNLWVGTSGGGINIFSDGVIMTYSTADGLSSGDILPVLIDRNGDLWAGTANDGLDVLLKNGGKKHYSTANGLTDNRILSLFEHENGEIWVGTVKGLSVINPLTGKVSQILKGKMPLSFSVSNIIRGPDGSIWAGTHGDYIFTVSDYEFDKTIGRNEGINDGIILTFHPDRSGNLWIGTMNGLYFTDGRSSRVTDTSGGLSSNTVYSLYIDEDGNIWTGTDSGLNIISDGIVYRVRNIEFLYHDSIYSIAPDGNGNIWLGSNKGLFKASLKEVLEKTLKNDNSFEFKRYSYADGMKSMECNGGFTPSYSFHDNLLYFPTLNGISVVNLKIDILNRTVPNLIIEKIFSEDTSGDLHNGNPVVFKPGSRKFEIKYTAPSFVNPQAIKFKYRLFGFDNDLVDAGNRRTAYYTNLKPGDYTFFVTASNNEGIWNKEGEKLDFSITPYFYQTWPFYAFIIILSVFSISLPIMGYSRKKIRTIEIEKIELEKRALEAERRYEKSRIDEEISVTYLEKLFELMDDKKIYRNPDLTLQMLADRMKISHLYLSQIINVHTSMTFYTLLNMYRVLEVMEKLQNEKFKDENIITLAYESGFNTKSTFNSIFKKFSGVTPTEYRKKFFV